MNENQMQRLLLEGADEILSLRRQLEAVEPKAYAYDLLAQILGFFPQPSQGFVPDVREQMLKMASQISMEMSAGKGEKSTLDEDVPIATRDQTASAMNEAVRQRGSDYRI